MKAAGRFGELTELFHAGGGEFEEGVPPPGTDDMSWLPDTGGVGVGART